MGKNIITSIITEEIFPAVMENHVSRMPKPKEVLVVEDESGNVIQEPYKDTESISLYESMKRTLILLTTLDGKNMTQIILKRLNLIVSCVLLPDSLKIGFPALTRSTDFVGPLAPYTTPCLLIKNVITSCR